MKIDIANELKSSLPIILLFWLISGYIYLNPYYSYFNINVENFFSLEDYLCASIGNVTSILINMALALFMGYWSSEEDKLLHNNITEDNGKCNAILVKRHKFDLILILILLLINIISSVIFTYIYKRPERFTYYGIILFVLWLIFFKEIFLRSIKYKVYEVMSPLMVAIIFFFIPYSVIYLYFSAKHNAAFIVETNQAQKVMVTIKKDYAKDGIENNEIILIGSNSTYMFLYNKIKKNIYIMPSKLIEKLEMPYDNKSEGNSK